MKKLGLLLIFIPLLVAGQKHRVILAVFAHGDDEKIVAPVLAKYAAEGADVYLAVATDGRYGVTDQAQIPTGDSLARVRRREIICAAQQLGIHPPVLMAYQDGLNANIGQVQSTLDSAGRQVVKLFDELKPDVVITWGASGWTGHPDHRLIGDVVTDVFIWKKWGKPTQLYYPEIPSGYFAQQSNSYATVDLSYLTVQIPLSSKDLAKAKVALHCHQSQYTWDYAENTNKRIWKLNKPIAFLRPFKQKKEIQHSLLEPITR